MMISVSEKQKYEDYILTGQTKCKRPMKTDAIPSPLYNQLVKQARTSLARFLVRAILQFLAVTAKPS